jgi:D-alanyl-D-alanine carboxypeptidase
LPATLGLTAGLILVPGLAVAAVTLAQLDTLDADVRGGFDPVAVSLSGLGLALVAAGVLGALTMGSEFATGAITTTMISAPRRWTVLVAKAVVLGLTTFPVLFVTTGTTYAVVQRVLAVRGLDAPLTTRVAVTALSAASALAGAALLGLALATLLRRTTGAVMAVVGLLLALPSLAGLVPGVAGATLQRYLPSTALTTLAVTSPAGADQAVLDAAARRWTALNASSARTGGFTVAVVRGDGAVLSSSAGAAADGQPLRPSAWSRMGSITKTYLATALLRAQARGMVDLDAPVSRYVPGAPGLQGLTVRMLLDQTSGLPDYAGTPAWTDAIAAAPDRAWTPEDVLSLVPRDVRAPGRYEYSNTNYVVAGLVLETVTGTDWRTAVREMVLSPLDLRNTAAAGRGLPITPGTAVDGRGETVLTSSGPYTAVETLAGPAGAMVATAPDLARFGRALLSGAALAPAQWRQMTAFGGRPAHYGLGLADLGATARDQGAPGPYALGNSGEIPGYGATVLLYPRSGTTVAVMSDDDRIADDQVAASIARDLGIDRDPAGWTTLGASILLLIYLMLAGAASGVVLTRRDI